MSKINTEPPHWSTLLILGACFLMWFSAMVWLPVAQGETYYVPAVSDCNCTATLEAGPCAPAQTVCVCPGHGWTERRSYEDGRCRVDFEPWAIPAPTPESVP